ncbi:hypothetical protein HDV00_007249 [Rhizophlyctis rosea]|nr:hypothetical protein HDV00_007249 [Rhizophlyctis rosea]
MYSTIRVLLNILDSQRTPLPLLSRQDLLVAARESWAQNKSGVVSVLTTFVVEKYGDSINFQTDDDAVSFKTACKEAGNVQDIIEKYHFNDITVIVDGFEDAFKRGHNAIWEYLMTIPTALPHLLRRRVIHMQSDAHFAEMVKHMVHHNLDPDHKIQLAIIAICIDYKSDHALNAALDHFPAAARDIDATNRWNFVKTACKGNNMNALVGLHAKGLLPRIRLSDIGGLVRRAGAAEDSNTLEFIANILPKIVEEDHGPSAVVSSTKALIRYGTTTMLQSVSRFWSTEYDTARYVEQAIRRRNDAMSMFVLKRGAELTPAHLVFIVDRILDGRMSKDVLALAFRNLLKRGLNIDLGFLASKMYIENRSSAEET